MRRQEFLLNLTLVVIIGALGYQIYDAYENPPEAPVAVEYERGSADDEDNADENDGDLEGTETLYNPAEGTRRFPNLGNKPLFAAIITPTPTPTPTPPPPAPTPDITKGLSAWRVLSVDRGEIIVEDVALLRQRPEDAIWEMKIGDTRAVDMGGGQVHTVTLKATDESNEMELPTAIFTMEGTTVERVLRMGDEPTGDAGKANPPG